MTILFQIFLLRDSKRRKIEMENTDDMESLYAVSSHSKAIS